MRHPNPDAPIAEAVAEYEAACVAKLDRWVVAACGTETPFTFDGRRFLYVYNPARGHHGYLNLETDVVVRDYRFGDGTTSTIGAAE